MPTATIHLNIHTDAITRHLAAKEHKTQEKYVEESLQEWCRQRLKADPQLQRDYDAGKIK